MVIRRIKRAVDNISRPSWKTESAQLTIGREFHEFKKVFRDNFVTLIVSAFGVVAALSWNDAIKQAIVELFPTGADMITKLYTALLITAISIFATYLLSKLKSK